MGCGRREETHLDGDLSIPLDFLAATADFNLMIATKAAKDMENADVKAKAEAPVTWCRHASEYSQGQGGKARLIVPADVPKPLDGCLIRHCTWAKFRAWLLVSPARALP